MRSRACFANSAAQRSTAQHSMAPHSTAQQSTAQTYQSMRCLQLPIGPLRWRVEGIQREAFVAIGFALRLLRQDIQLLHRAHQRHQDDV